MKRQENNKKLSYCRWTVRHATLVEICQLSHSCGKIAF